MAVPWLKVLDTVGSLVQMSAGPRRDAPADGDPAARGGALGTIEARLAGVVVAALQEAFDRDKARMDLERSQVEAEQRRAAEALAAELRRQMGERALGQLRMIAIIAIAAWMLSAVLAAWLPAMATTTPRLLMGGGWALLFAAIGCAFAGWQVISAWTGTSGTSGSPAAPVASATADPMPRSGPAAAAPWLLIAALVAIAVSVLAAL